MNETFTASAACLAGMICRQLYWRPADFWSATPAEIAAIFHSGPAGEDGGVSRTELENLMERNQDG